MPLMSLGLFSFSVETAPFESIKRSTKQVWATAQRVGGPPAAQHVGQGEETISLTGTLFPGQLTGGPSHLETLRQMAAQVGKCWILSSGQGEHLGLWYITDLSEDRSYLTKAGLPRKIDFTLSLTRCWDADATSLGAIEDSDPARTEQGYRGAKW